ncbi:metallophosphoesterase [Aquirufa sp. ROCK-SH2]
MPRLLLFTLLSFSGLGQNIIRGPYLQLAGPTQMTLRFRTDIPSMMHVRVSAGIYFNRIYSNDLSIIDHTFLLDSLKPNMKYYYQIGTSKNFSTQDSTQFFTTAPVIGTNEKMKFGVIGDMYPGSTQLKVFEALKKHKGNSDYQFMLTLGDNVYSGATDADYQQNFFNVYSVGNFLKQVPIYTALGNHDYDYTSRVQDDKTIAYFTNFDLPSKGQFGGIPSHSEAFYSYDYANIHFISLDTEGIGKDGKRLTDDNSDQVNWLLRDLASTKMPWKIVYFHHPPFTKGTYDSDVVSLLTLVRQKLVPIFEKYKVDLVLNGHSHVYERSKPLTNFTGISNGFDAKINWTQASSGKYDNSLQSCPYMFSSADTAKNGVVYVVNGVGGATGRKRTDAPHKVMQYSVDQIGGFMYFEIEDNRLDAKFITENGDNLDRFTIFKDVPNQVSVTKSINYLDKVILTAPWKGDYLWTNGEKNKNIEVSPKQNTSFSVVDANKCLSYTYQINVIFPDTDSDGVTDNIDQCLNTPKGQKVDANGCADSQKDTDGDGIMDDKDDCPNIVNPKAPVISTSNGFDLTTLGGANYQWFYNGQAISSATQSNFKALNSGQYTVQLKSQQGCISPISAAVSVIITATKEEKVFLIYPNPFESNLTISLPENMDKKANLSLYNLLGVEVYSKDSIPNQYNVNLEHLPAGIYILKIQFLGNPDFWVQKMLKSK